MILIAKKKRASNGNIILFTFSIISSPILAEQFNFTLQCAEVAISLFIFDVGLFFFFRSFQRRVWIIIAILCFTGLGCYQTFMTLLIAMLVANLLMINQERISWRENRNYIIWSIVTVFVSFVLYSIISKLVNYQLGIVSTSYLKEQILWFSNPILKNLINLMGYGGKVFLGYGKFYNYSYFLTFILCIYNIYQHKEKKFYCLLHFCCLLPPFLLAILLGHSEVVRAQITLPIVVAFILLFVPIFLIIKIKSSIIF